MNIYHHEEHGYFSIDMSFEELGKLIFSLGYCAAAYPEGDPSRERVMKFAEFIGDSKNWQDGKIQRD